MTKRHDWPYLEAENQAELLAYLGTAACAERYQTDNIIWVITGVDSNDYNGVLWARLAPAEADHVVPNVVQHFRERNLPALWHVDPASEPFDLTQRLHALGCRRLLPGVCMAAPLQAVPQPSLDSPGLTIERVATKDDLSAWMSVWVQGDKEQLEPRQQLYLDLGLDEAQPLRHYVARLHGVPVGIAQLFLGRRAAGLYCVAVLPAFRRQGIGTALCCTAFHVARSLGYDIGVLGPSPEGQPMYQRLGFELFPSPFVGYTLWRDE